MKKIICLILAAIMLTAIPCGALASGTQEFVGKLGIMTGDGNGNFDDDGLLTREQFAKITVEMVDPDFIPMNSVSPFADVSYQSWASGYIKRSSELGYFTGFPDGTFRPSEYVLPEQICKVMLNLLGYDNKSAGVNWAQSQISVAGSKGLLDDVDYTIGEPITRINAAKIIKNTLLTQKKDSDQYFISDMGYTYYENAVIITDKNVQSGYVLTSAGTFKKGDISPDTVSKKGALIVNKKNEIFVFLPAVQHYASYIAKEILPDRMYVYDENKNEILWNVSKDAVLYNGTSITSYGQGFGTITKGDNVSFYYDENNALEYIAASENTNIQSGEEYIVKSVIADGFMAFDKSGDKFIKCDNDTAVYEGAITSNYQAISDTISMGDKITVYRNGIDEIQYMTVTRNVIEGPFTNIGGSFIKSFHITSDSVISRDGKTVKIEDIEDYDICYYIKQADTAVIYGTKVTGIYQEALPNKDHLQKIILSGKEYEIGSVVAFNKLSSNGNISYGESIKILLDKDGKIADVITLAQSDALMGYLLNTSLKSWTDGNKEAHTQYCSTVLLLNGTTEDYYSDKDYGDYEGKVVSIKFSNGKAVITLQNRNNNISGIFNWTKKALGNYALADDVNIIDVAYRTEYTQAKGKKIFPQRLEGASLSASDVSYIQTQGNLITDIVLNDYTNDLYEYGVVLKAENKSGQMMMQGTYELNAAGTYMKFVTTNVLFSVYTGQPVRIDLDNNTLNGLTKLTNINGKITKVDDSYAYVQEKKYLLSDDVLVYQKVYNTSNNGVRFEIIPKGKIDYTKNVTAYYDKAERNGGRVRIIVLSD